MKPYYEKDGIVIYHGDCRDVLPTLPKVDLVLTDPPYGIADIWKGGFGSGWGKAQEQAIVRNVWDENPPDPELLKLVTSHGRVVIMWGGNYFPLPPSRCWLVWNKPERGFSLAEAELAWTNRDAVVRVCDCNRSEPDREHPTQKPLKLMMWCVEWSKTTGMIIDPFMGSGTTLVAAKKLDRPCVGIEANEAYCEIAVRRLENTTPSLFSETA